jgi:hypothetical protein
VLEQLPKTWGAMCDLFDPCVLRVLCDLIIRFAHRNATRSLRSLPVIAVGPKQDQVV